MSSSTDTEEEPKARARARAKASSPKKRLKVLKEYNNKQYSKPKINQNHTNISLLNKFNKNAIREKVHQYFFRNELPTIDKVLKDVNEDPDLPNFKRSTFSKLLTSLNFTYESEKYGSKSTLIEKDKIVIWRRKYLKKIGAYRNEQRKIYYLGENSISGFSTGVKNTSGKENRLLFCHIGSDDGFVPNGLWAFESKKTKDHQEEKSDRLFEKWFANILPQLEENSVIVLDNAPYCSRKVENIPTTATSKADIQQWLRSKNIHFEEDLLKLELLVIVDEHKRKYNKYVIDEMAKVENKIVLRLPPFHCELNPIEPILADVKNIVAEHSNISKHADMKKIIIATINNISTEKWQKCINHVKENVEPKMWKIDNLTEVHVESLINVDGDTASDENNLDEKVETKTWLDNTTEDQVEPLLLNVEDISALKRIKTEPEFIGCEEDTQNYPFNILSDENAANIKLESTVKLENYDECLYEDVKMENKEITINNEDKKIEIENIIIKKEHIFGPEQ